MASSKHATKRSVQTLNISSNSTPIKAVKTKIAKPNSTPEKMVEEDKGRTITLDQIHKMLKIMMKKLDKLM